VYQFWITPADPKARPFDRVELTADAYGRGSGATERGDIARDRGAPIN
jgi:hypothetical protein